MDQLRADALLDLLGGEGVAVGQPLTAHTAGLPVGEPADPAPASGQQPTRARTADPRIDRARIDRAGIGDARIGGEPAGGAEPTGGDPAGGIAGAAPAGGDGVGGQPKVEPSADPGLAGRDGGVEPEWDPRWPPGPPPERIGAHDVHPDPTGEPVDRWDAAGQAFDGDDLWPPDWPGRWLHDPAVSAARGRCAAVDIPPDAAGPGQVPTGGPVAAGGGQPALAPAALPGPRRGVVELQVPLTTLLRISDHPGELAGFGPVIADIARQVATQQRSATWRFSVYDKTGELAHHGITHQRPTSAAHTAAPRPPATSPPTGRQTTRQDAAGQEPSGQEPSGRRPAAQVAAFVRARDRTCVAPGCRRPGTGCDIDHTLDWARGGPTDPANLGLLCRRHHRFKHAPGTDLIQLTPGVFSP
jgi:hypothetical protein